MNEQTKKFLEEVSKDKELQSELRKVTNQNLAEIAKGRGYDLTPDDFDKNRELSKEELLAVAGGADNDGDGFDDDTGKIIKCVCPTTGASFMSCDQS